MCMCYVYVYAFVYLMCMCTCTYMCTCTSTCVVCIHNGSLGCPPHCGPHSFVSINGNAFLASPFVSCRLSIRPHFSNKDSKGIIESSPHIRIYIPIHTYVQQLYAPLVCKQRHNTQGNCPYAFLTTMPPAPY